MINRNIPPKFQTIKTIELKSPVEKKFSNDIPVFVFSSNKVDLIRVEFAFTNLYDDREFSLLNNALNSLLKEGSKKYSSSEIAEKIDYFGAYLVPEFNVDRMSLSLFCMRKHLRDILPLVKELLTEAIFPEEELAVFVRNTQQQILVSLEKNDILSQREFNKQIFGENRYGSQYVPEDLLKIERPDLLALYEAQVHEKNCTVFVSGNVLDEDLKLINDLFANDWFKRETRESTFQDADVHFPEFKPKEVRLHKKDSIQASIRLGKRCVQRSHPDFPAIQFTNMVLGGYFGSRLMKNIREDKGYSYGIGSGLRSLRHLGIFGISTQVGTEYVEATVQEIHKELDILCTDLLSPSELELVRNYMMGAFVRSLSSIFSHADKYKAVYYSSLDMDYYQRYIQEIQSISSSKVREIAQKYFQKESLSTIIVS